MVVVPVSAARRVTTGGVQPVMSSLSRGWYRLGPISRDRSRMAETAGVGEPVEIGA
jgi:hypothetical protein